MSRKSKKKTSAAKTELAPRPEQRPWWHACAVCIGLVAMVWIIFGQSATFEFVNCDDGVIVTENKIVQGGLTLPGIVEAFTCYDSKFYSPIRLLSHMLDRELFGSWAGGHHLTNVLLHTASTLLLFLALQKMTLCFWESACVAALFAIHPLHVESVAWVSERKDTMSGLFCMLTLLAYAYYTSRQKSRLWSLIVAIAFAMGLLSKPTLVPLPFCLLLLDYWPLKRFDPQCYSGRKFKIPWALIREKSLLFALTLAACIVAIAAQANVVAASNNFPLFARVENALISIVVYLWQTIYPVNLAAFYPHPGNSIPLWKPAAALIVVLLTSWFVFTKRQRCPYLIVGWLWFLAMLVPVSGIVQFGDFATADRFMYLPQIGLSIAAVWGISKLSETWAKRREILTGLATVALSVLMVCSYRQASYWANSEALWTHALSCNSENYFAHSNYGSALLKKGDLDGSITHLEKSLKLNPDQSVVHANLGRVYYQQKRFKEAIQSYAIALQMDPNLMETYDLIALAIVESREDPQAIPIHLNDLQLRPTTMTVPIRLGNALMRAEQFEEAIAQFRYALKMDPRSKEALGSLANALFTTNDFEGAAASYEELLKVDPSDFRTHANLASMFIEKGDISKALEYTQRANQLTGGTEPKVLQQLATLYFYTQNKTEAVKTARRAATLAEEKGDTELAASLIKEAEAYESNNPPSQ